MNRPRSAINTALTLASALFLFGIAGCATAGPPNPGEQLAGTELHFNLNQCQPMGPNLWKCPAIDKPICRPDYVGTDIQCVRVDKSGKVIIQQMQL